jgi:glycosyltransferase involved in cell wall biosynthesis
VKIVQLITALQLGGAEKVAIDIVKNVNKDEFEVLLVTVLKDNSVFSRKIKNELSESAIKWQEFGFFTNHKILKYIVMVFSTFQIFYFLLKYKPNIVHSHTDFPDFVLANILRIYSILGISPPKIVRTIHNTELWPSHPRIANYVEKTFINDSVVFISNAANQAYSNLRSKLNLSDSPNTYFISNGIDLSKQKNHSDLATLANHHVKLEKNKVNFLFVGRLTAQKGFDLLLEALNLFDAEYQSKFHLHVFGAGEQEALLRNTNYLRLPISKYPPTPEIHSLYGCFDYLIMPSRFEGLPLVCLESLAAGLPVIATNAPGLNEAIPANWPLTCQNENVDALMLVIKDVLDAKYKPNMFEKVAREFVEKKFCLTRTVLKYENLYRGV